IAAAADELTEDGAKGAAVMTLALSPGRKLLTRLVAASAVHREHSHAAIDNAALAPDRNHIRTSSADILPGSMTSPSSSSTLTLSISSHWVMSSVHPNGATSVYPIFILILPSCRAKFS